MPQPKTGTRRVAALAASALLAASAAGCGGGGGGTLGNGVRPIKKDRLTTCTHLPYPPFEFERGGEIVGFDVDLVNLVAQRLGVRQEIVDTPFETIKTGADLNAGKCDIAATGLTITEERKKNLDFSVGYFDATQAVLARKGSAIRSLDDLKGKRLGARPPRRARTTSRARASTRCRTSPRMPSSTGCAVGRWTPSCRTCRS